jgi:hypothetical protein
MNTFELRWPDTRDRKAFLAAVFGATGPLTLRARFAAWMASRAVRSGADMRKATQPVPPAGRRLLARFEREDPGRHDALIAEGWSENLIVGACMSSLPEPALIYSRLEDIRAGDLVAFAADAMPQGMVKAFVGWRRSNASGVDDFMSSAGGIDCVFYAEKPEMLLIVPGAYLRAAERIGYVKPKRGRLQAAAPCDRARLLGVEYGLDGLLPASRLPHAPGGLRGALGEVLSEIQRRAV